MLNLKIGRFEILGMVDNSDNNSDINPVYQVVCNECETIHNMTMAGIKSTSGKRCNCLEIEEILLDSEKITVEQASMKYHRSISELKTISEENGAPFQAPIGMANAHLAAFLIVMLPAYRIMHDMP